MKHSFKKQVTGKAATIGGIAILLMWLALIVFLVVGYIMNVAKVIGIASAGVPIEQQIELVIRIIGFVLIPIGAILGMFW